jgi:GrpB-like predicted nucleotidyltransferase (UPF0157 family)
MAERNELDKVEIHEYDPRWAEEFEREKAAILAVLEGVAGIVDIEHIGSTAVPGLAAKPVIDLQIGVQKLGAAEEYVERLAKLGYVNHPQDDPGRLFFRKGMPRTHHLHIVEHGSWDHRRHLTFRDNLRADPETLAEYQALKRELAAKHPLEREEYVEGKTAFVEAVVARTLKS